MRAYIFDYSKKFLSVQEIKLDRFMVNGVIFPNEFFIK